MSMCQVTLYRANKAKQKEIDLANRLESILEIITRRASDADKNR